VVGVCESERRLAVSSGVVPPERCTTIENGVEFSPLPRVDRAQKLASLGLPADAQVILCVGDLRPQKGHLRAIMALREVREAVPGAHLLIAGEGPARRRLESAAAACGEGHVHLLGQRDDVRELLACCDVFCQPSLWEGCPYALIEAAAAGCGIVGTAIPGIVDIVEDGVTGWTAPVRPEESLAAALIDALAHPRKRERRGLAAWRLVKERHSLARMVELTGRLYEQVAREAERRW